jgi:hypothetical protein
MAKRRRRHGHKRYGGIVAIPGFGKLDMLSNSPVKPMDVAIGAGVGLVGTVGIKWLLAKVPSINNALPQIVKDYLGPISSIASGVAAYAISKKFLKKSTSTASGYFIGAAVAGAVPLAATALKTAFPTLAGINTVNMGFLAPSPRPMGLMLPSPRAQLKGLAAVSMANQTNRFPL